MREISYTPVEIKGNQEEISGNLARNHILYFLDHLLRLQFFLPDWNQQRKFKGALVYYYTCVLLPHLA